jgi:hypothetical protein
MHTPGVPQSGLPHLGRVQELINIGRDHRNVDEPLSTLRQLRDKGEAWQVHY